MFRCPSVPARSAIIAVSLGSLLFAGALEAAEWAKTYGGAGADSFSSMQPTADGGYVAAGSTASFGAGGTDAWVLKLAADGSIAWQKTYGGAADDDARFVSATSDGGFLVTGTTGSFGTGGANLWVLKLDSNGNVAWQRTYGGAIPADAQSTADGGLFVVGTQGLALKLDAAGDIVWQRNVAVFSPGFQAARSGRPTADGGYVLAGYVSPRPAQASGWLAKLDASGDVVWLKHYGSSSYSTVDFVQTTSDGGYVLLGQTDSYGFLCGAGWVQKLDGSGNVVWGKTYSGMCVATSGRELADGSFIVSGDAQAYPGTDTRAVVMKLDRNGNVVWQNAYGGGGSQSSLSAQPTSDGGYVAAGRTNSYGSGDFDAWLLKLDAGGAITGCAGVTASSATSTNTLPNAGDGTPFQSASNVASASSTASARDSSATALQQCYYVPPTEPPVCAMSAGTATPHVGDSLVLTAACTNSPTGYAWTGCASTGPTCSDTRTVSGARTYVVTATNAIGTSAPASLTVTWLAAASEIPTLSAWSLLVAAGALGMSAMAMLRRRRSGGRHGRGAAGDAP